MQKRDLFFYFILRLKETYNLINPKEELNIKNIFYFLFIAVLKEKRLLTDLWKWLNFDKFILSIYWIIIEEDCFIYIQELWEKFETVILKDKEKIKNEIKNNIEENVKNILDTAILKIWYFYEKDTEYLKEYIKYLNSSKNTMDKLLYYWKKFFYIDKNDILEDKLF